MKQIALTILNIAGTIGALNFGLLGVLKRNFLAEILSEKSSAYFVMQILVGLWGLYAAYSLYVQFSGCCSKK